MDSAITIGSITATIAGDTRYTDELIVTFNRDTQKVTVKVRETTPSGGMDSIHGFLYERVTFHEECDADPKIVIKLIKKVTSNPLWNFKKYGRPTKNFLWASGPRGLNVNLVADELKNIKRD